MEKYLVTIEFRYTTIDEEDEAVYNNKVDTIGVYDTVEDAVLNGNKVLEYLEENFELNKNWNVKRRLGTKADKYLVSDMAYLITPFQFFLKIETLKYNNPKDTIAKIMKEIK